MNEGQMGRVLLRTWALGCGSLRAWWYQISCLSPGEGHLCEGDWNCHLVSALQEHVFCWDNAIQSETAHPASLAVGRGHVMGFWLENEMETFRASALYCLCLSSPVCMQTPPGTTRRRVSPSGGQVLGSEDVGPQRLDPPWQDSQILYDP